MSSFVHNEALNLIRATLSLAIKILAKRLPHQSNGMMSVEEVMCDNVYKACSTVSATMVSIREMRSSNNLLSYLDLVATHVSMDVQLLAQPMGPLSMSSVSCSSNCFEHLSPFSRHRSSRSRP